MTRTAITTIQRVFINRLLSGGTLPIRPQASPGGRKMAMMQMRVACPGTGEARRRGPVRPRRRRHGAARDHTAGVRTVQTDAQIGPPMLNVAAARAFGTWSGGGTFPRSCHAAHPTIAIPVAPIGWPFAMRPPDVLMPHAPSGRALPSTQYAAPLPAGALPTTSVPIAP